MDHATSKKPAGGMRMEWYPVRDAAGRTRLEAHWVAVAAVAPARPGAHAA